MIKLVMTDLDDTLISHDAGQENASPRALDAIRELLDAGVHFGPVSGRTPSSMEGMFCGYEPAYATGAFSNGQIVLLDGSVIHREYCPVEPLQRVADICDAEGDAALTLYGMDYDGQGCFVTSRGTRPHVGLSAWSRLFGMASCVEEPSLKANVHLAQGSRVRHTEIRDLLRSEVPELDFVFPSNSAPILDILPAGYGKGSAVRILAQALGLGDDEIATFGDSENDLSMLEPFPYAVAVGNACAEAKAATRWHIGPSAEDSVAAAFEQIAQATRRGELPAFLQG